MKKKSTTAASDLWEISILEEEILIKQARLTILKAERTIENALEQIELLQKHRPKK